MKEEKILMQLRRSRFVRFLAALLDERGTLMIATIVGAVLLLIQLQSEKTSPSSPMNSHGLLYLIVFVVSLLLLQTWKVYLEKTYDPEISWHLWEDFEGLKEPRSIAASACLEYLKLPRDGNPRWNTIPNRKAIEDVLDTLEDVGFYMRAHQLSDEMAHHYFGHYIILYWMAGGDDYVSQRRSKEPTTWGNIEYAFDRIFYLESTKSNKDANEMKEHFKSKINEYLTEEVEEFTQPLPAS